jgi:hypothetical protein
LRLSSSGVAADESSRGNDETFYEELDHMIQKEPIGFIDPEPRRLAAAIGIEKGKPSKPDVRVPSMAWSPRPVACENGEP